MSKFTFLLTYYGWFVMCRLVLAMCQISRLQRQEERSHIYKLGWLGVTLKVTDIVAVR